MKEAIAIIEETITDYRFKADKLEEIVNDLKKLNGAAPDPDPLPPPKYKEVFSVNVERVDVPLKSFAEALSKKEVSEAPIQELVVAAKKHVAKKPTLEKAKAATKQFFPTGRDVFTESAVSKNGKNFIPSDQMILEALKSLNTEANSGTVKNELMKKSELPILQQIVENGLKRLCKMELVLKNATTRPITWAVKQMESQAEEPKKLVLTDDMYENRQLFAKSKGYESRCISARI